MSAMLIAAASYLPMPTAARFFTLKDDDVYYSLSGAQSFSFINQSLSTGRTYRNELPSSYIGRSWLNIVLSSVDSQNFGQWGPSGAVPAASLSQGSTTAIDQLMDTITSKDDRFNATVPFDLPGMLTFMVFWDGATGSGNVVAMCPANLFEQFSSAIPVRY